MGYQLDIHSFLAVEGDPLLKALQAQKMFLSKYLWKWLKQIMTIGVELVC